MATGLVWDSTDTDWDDPTAAWDGAAFIAQPAFQGTAFQQDAFQTSAVLSITVTQSMPAFRQAADTFHGSVAQIEQTMPAFTQVVGMFNGLLAVIEQTIPGFLNVANPLGFQFDAFQLDAFDAGHEPNSQVVESTLTVRARIGIREGDFQDDAFQDDAFEIGIDQPQRIPFPQQHANVANVPHGQTIVAITQSIPAFTQTADATTQSGIAVTQVIPLPQQLLTGFEVPAAAVVQVAPAFTQTAQAAVLISPVGTVQQTMPMFTQTLRVSIVRWDEWETTSGLEWPVSVDDEWLVRR